MNIELFQIWVRLEKIDTERLSWKQMQSLIKEFENEEKQNSFSYRMALGEYERAKVATTPICENPGCGRTLDLENNEYHRRFGTCDAHCYGEMVGV